MRAIALAALLLLSVVTPPALATDYYNCSAGSFPGASASPTGSPCDVFPGVWNNPAHRLIIRNGTGYSTGSSFHFNASLQVLGNFAWSCFSTVSSFSGNVYVGPGGVFIWQGSGCFVVIESTSTFLIEEGGTIQLNATGSSLAINGVISGDGALSWTPTISGTGNINGIPATSLTSPLDLTNVGITWNGSAWSPAGGPTLASDRAIFSGDYTASVDPPAGSTFAASRFKLNSGAHVVFDDDLDLDHVTRVVNDGIFELVDDTTVGPGLTIMGGGNMLLRRSVNLPSNAYLRMCFPVSAQVLTYNDVQFANFPKASTRFWNAASSTWSSAVNATILDGRALAIWGANGSNRSVSLSVPHFFFNNQADQFDLAYHDPGAAPGFTPGATDGWNQLCNPFMDFLSSQAVVDLMETSGDFQSNAVSVWDGSQYRVWADNGGAGNDPEAEYMANFEAFFVRTAPTHDGSFTITNAARANARPADGDFVVWKFGRAEQAPASFGVSLTATVVGETKRVRTYIGRASGSSSVDTREEVPFQSPVSALPTFYSVDESGTSMRLNKVPDIHRRTVALGFGFARTARITIHADDINLPKGTYAELYDRRSGSTVRIDKESYSFDHDGSAAAERFELRFKGGTRGF